MKANGYRNIPAGQKNAGEVPQRSRKGAAAETGVAVEDRAAGFPYSVPETGTVPERNVVFRYSATQIDAETALNALGYRNIPAGQKNAGETPQRNAEGQKAEGGTIGGELQTAVFQHKTTLCGNKR